MMGNRRIQKLLEQLPGLPRLLRLKMSNNQLQAVADTDQPAPAPVQLVPPSNPSFDALTAGLPMRYEDGLYISRVLNVPDSPKKQKFFDSDPDFGIRAQLMPFIRFRGDDTRLGNYADYVMGGKSPNEVNWQPLVVIFCANKHQQETIVKRLKNMSQTILKSYEYVIVTEETLLASGELDSSFVDIEEDHRNVSGAFDTTLPTLCGMTSSVNYDLLTSSQQHTCFKLGGLVSINEKVYGLTTAHKISKKDPNWRFPLKSRAGAEANTEGPGKLVAVGHLEAFEYTFPRDVNFRGRSWDWALIKLQDDCIRPNLVSSPYPHDGSTPEYQHVPVQGYLPRSALSFGEVWVVESPSSSILAVLIEQPVLLAFGDNNFEAYSIGLTKPLEDGSSGSWVIRDGKVCGYIFSRVVGKPWAYMLPIEPVIDRISEYYSSKGPSPVSVTIPLYDKQAIHPTSGEMVQVEPINDITLDLSSIEENKPVATSKPTSLDVSAGSSDSSKTSTAPAHPAGTLAPYHPAQPTPLLSGSGLDAIETTIESSRANDRASDVASDVASLRPYSRSSTSQPEVSSGRQVRKPVSLEPKMPAPEPSWADRAGVSHMGSSMNLPYSKDKRTELPENLVARPANLNGLHIQHMSSALAMFERSTTRVSPPLKSKEKLFLWITSRDGQHLRGRFMTECVIFQDFLYRFANTFAEHPVTFLDSKTLATMLEEPSFKENIRRSMSQTKIDTIGLTCHDIDQHVERLMSMIEASHNRLLFMIEMRKVVFSRKAAVGKQLDLITECNTRLSQLMAYLRPREPDYAHQHAPDVEILQRRLSLTD
ncbi:hypothetical protein ONS96_014849 [Cadophora gregata f. sp. sojae]|nr:hypothetical protein ONS96_014849 [Cadophora gregata f. sp. sojae]